jgi:hypothetical protein
MDENRPRMVVKRDANGALWIFGKPWREYVRHPVIKECFLRFELPPGTSEAKAEELARWLYAQFPEIAICALMDDDGNIRPFHEEWL